MLRFFLTAYLFLIGLSGFAVSEVQSLRIDRLEENPEKLRLSWSTLFGNFYELQESETLLDWRTVDGYPVRALVQELHHDVSPKAASGFFRVFDLGPPEPEVEVVFSVAGPTGNEVDLTLEEKLKDLLELAEPGSQVFAAVYTWSRETMADAFIEAYQRGVDVRLIVGSDYPAVRKLQQTMRSGRVLVCRNKNGEPAGCHGGSINHNKFFLFSQLADGSRDVVVQSSANLTNTQIRMHNNMLVIRNDTALFNAYLSYWEDLYRETEDLNYYRETSSPTASVYFFPRAEGNGQTGEKDTIIEILNEISPGPETEIHVAMAFWTGPRIAIARRLVELRKSGAAVRVIFDGGNSGAGISRVLLEGDVELIDFPYVHSKYLLIQHGAGRLRQRVVLTGSHNYTGPALRSNDEVLLRLTNDSVYQNFFDDWNRMAGHSEAVKVTEVAVLEQLSSDRHDPATSSSRTAAILRKVVEKTPDCFQAQQIMLTQNKEKILMGQYLGPETQKP